MILTSSPTEKDPPVIFALGGGVGGVGAGLAGVGAAASSGAAFPLNSLIVSMIDGDGSASSSVAVASSPPFPFPDFFFLAKNLYY